MAAKKLKPVDVAIVGAGCVGTIVAKELAVTGLKVALLCLINRQGDVTKTKGPGGSPKPLNLLAPRPGLEPGTYGLTVRRSTD